MGYFGEESTTTKISIGYTKEAPLYSRTISAEEFTTMPAESTFWEDAGLDDYMKCKVIEEPAPIASGSSYYVHLYNSTDRLLKDYHIVKDATTGGYKFVAASDTFLKITANKRFNIIVCNNNDYSIIKVYPMSFSEMSSMAHKTNYDICEIDGLPRVRLMVDWEARKLHMKGINNTTPSGDGIFKEFNADGFLDTADIEFYTPKAVVKKGVKILVTKQ